MEEKLRAKLDSEILDVGFSYENEEGFIMPCGSKVYDVWYGDIVKHYTSLNKLMSDKIYHGKSLAEIANSVKPKYY